MISHMASNLLRIDAAAEADRIAAAIRELVLAQFRRKGVVVGVSGGIDSGVVAALSVRALGPERVVALLMPESESASESLELGRLLAEDLGIRSVCENITPILNGAGCYRRRDDAIRSILPEYGPGYKCKITLPDLLAGDRFAVYSVVAQSPSGETKKVRLPLEAYLGIVAASNFKQRTRKMIEYYHADLLHYAVAGTPNRLEYDLGFFVKCGDGAADFKPIAHLYKSQVYQLAEYLGIPDEIRSRPPTTDTYSLGQSQEEFYFSMPLDQMDLCLYSRNHEIDAARLAAMTGLTEVQAKRAYAMIDAKRRNAQYLHMPPVLCESQPASAEIEHVTSTVPPRPSRASLTEPRSNSEEHL
jgi:NAD+ synthase